MALPTSRASALLTACAVLLTGCSSNTPTGPGGTSTGGRTPAAPPASTTPGSTSGPGFGPVVATGLEVPWGLAHLPDGTALVAQRDKGTVLHLRPGRTPRFVATLDDVRPEQEAGLLGIAVSPEFATDKRVFVYYTAESDNRVERLTWTGSTLKRDRVILKGIPKAQFHNGGRLAFGPDDRLYVTTGDAGVTDRAQDRDSLGGKILRVTQDGAPAPGNPFPDSPVWSLGHRNVQGIAWDEEDRMFATEFGQNTWDELNRIEKAANYGWPEVEGKGGGSEYVDPQVTWTTSESSPSGLAITDGKAYVAALAGERLWEVPLKGGRAGSPTRANAPDLGRVRTVEVAPDGALWLVSSNTFRGEPRDGDDRVVSWQPG